MKVLIVDDSATARQIMRRIVTSLAFETEVAAGGREALDMLQDTRFDIMLLDWNMPDIAGIDLVRILRERESSVYLPILMVTQNVEREHILTALGAGVDEYLMKPFTAQALYEKLQLMGMIDGDSDGHHLTMDIVP